MNTSKQHGFSLLEVLVASVILMLIATGVMTIITENQKAFKNLTSRMGESMLITDLNQILADKAMCKKVLTESGTQRLTRPIFKPEITLPAYGTIEEGATLLGAIKVTKFEIDTTGQLPIDTAIPSQKKIIASLWLQTDDVNSALIDKKRKLVSTFSIYYNATNNNIESCDGAMPEAEMCHKLGGTWSNSVCIISNIANNISILNKSCGSGLALSGFNSAGDPICTILPDRNPSSQTSVSSNTATAITNNTSTGTQTSLATTAIISGMQCSPGIASPDKEIMQVYFSIGRCAETGGFSYWRQNYYSSLNSGVSPAEAMSNLISGMQSAATSTPQSAMDNLCPDGGINYKFVPGPPGNPRNYCTVRCSASPTNLGCVN